MRDDIYISDNDKCAIFPRNQHPDTRSDKQYMEMLNKKLKLKYQPIPEKWYPGKPKHYPNRKRVICLNTGVVYDGIRVAEEALGVSTGHIGKHLRKDRFYSHVKKMKFAYYDQ
jgi:hypothetical protein